MLFDDCLLDGMVHLFNLAVGLRMAYLRESMFDVVCFADTLKGNRPIDPEASIPSRLANAMLLSVNIA